MDDKFFNTERRFIVKDLSSFLVILFVNYNRYRASILFVSIFFVEAPKKWGMPGPIVSFTRFSDPYVKVMKDPRYLLTYFLIVPKILLTGGTQ